MFSPGIIFITKLFVCIWIKLYDAVYVNGFYTAINPLFYKYSINQIKAVIKFKLTALN